MSNFLFEIRKILLLLLPVLKYSLSSYCEPQVREYSCDCHIDPDNRTILVESSNITTNAFIPTLRALQYCQGTFYCRPNFEQDQVQQNINANHYLICFNDDACLSNGMVQNSLLSRGIGGDTCIVEGCRTLKEMLNFNVSNDALAVDVYKCVKIDPKDIKFQFCLNPVCKSFNVVENLCTCNYLMQNCSCSTFCKNSFFSVSHKTYALFLSFGDIYVATGAKINYLQYLILTILCIGSMIILIVFCNFYYTVDRLSMINETRNTEAIRRILTDSLDTSRRPTQPPAKEMEVPSPVVNRSSPPPTYEQVLKDKFSEFKKSVA